LADAASEEGRAISRHAWLVTAVLVVAMVALNHDFDVVGGRIEETVTSGGKLNQHELAEKEVTGGTLLRKLGLVALVAAGGLALIGPKTGARFEMGPLPVLVAAMVCWTAASWLWSVEPTRSLREIVRLGIYAVVAVLMVRRFRVHELMFMLLVVCAVAIAADAAADVRAGTFRPWQAEFRLGGALHPNHLGRLGAIVAMIGFAAAWEPRYRCCASMIFAGGIVVVILSASRSGLIGLVAGVTAITYLGLPARRIVFHATCAVAALGIGLLICAVSPTSLADRLSSAVLMGRTEDAGSLTGRMPLWTEMWKDGAERRWQGFGYGGYWTVDRNYELAGVIEWFPTHSHSAYMELLIDLGLIGLLLCLAIALVSIAGYARLVAATGRFEYRLLGALFVCGLVNGLFEVSFIWPRLEGLFVGMAVLSLFLKEPEGAIAPAIKPSSVDISRAANKLLCPGGTT
jgi:O-antigen ligase